MLTLEEAILHSEEIAEEQEKASEEWHENQVRKCELILFTEMDYTHENECKECAAEHRQLAEWLKDYKRLLNMEKSLEQEPCDDAISRQRVLKLIKERCNPYGKPTIDFEEGKKLLKYIDNLPSINPQPKTGHWIMIDKELQRYKCSECGEVIKLYKKSEIPKLEKDETLSDYPFSHCGCRMVEPQESEEKK